MKLILNGANFNLFILLIGNPCARKYKPVEFQFDPEIRRTARSLRREQRNSKAAVAMHDLQDMRNLNPHGEIQPVNGQEGQNGQNNLGQLRNNNIIYMADDKNKGHKRLCTVDSSSYTT